MDLISLASGYGNFAVPPVVSERVMGLLATGQQLPTGPVAGLPVLSEAIARRYGPGATTAQVVVTAGAKVALFTLFKALLQAGDEVLLPTPNWFGFGELVRLAGGTVRTLPLSATDNYTLAPEVLAAVITPRTRLLLLSNPNNPTGRVYHRAELDALLRVTSQHPGLTVVSDEIYDLITFGAEPMPSLLTWPDPHGQHVVVNGVSKSLALVGWGLGYLVAPAAVAQKCTAWQFATAGAAATLSQYAALAAIEQAQTIADTLKAQLATNRALLFDALEQLPNVRCQQAEGTYYAFPDFTAHLDNHRPAAEASAALAQRFRAAGVEVVDGATCGAPGFARLSYAVPEAALREAVRRLEQALR